MRVTGVGGGNFRVTQQLAKYPRYASRTKMLQAAAGIALELRPDTVSHDDNVIEQHGRSDWLTSTSSLRAIAVVSTLNRRRVDDRAPQPGGAPG